jgi:nucleoside-diphosphate-sugar epimerase
MSFIHLDDAAAATVFALERDGPALYNITDDEAAPMHQWLPVPAAALGAKPPPRRYPLRLGRLFVGDGLAVMTQARGAANAKAQKDSVGRCATQAGGRASRPPSATPQPLNAAA